MVSIILSTGPRITVASAASFAVERWLECRGCCITRLTGGIDLLFHTNTESGKTDDLDADPHVNVSFINASGEWASIAGNASISTDRSLVSKHYSPTLKAWLGDLGDGVHDGSENDPRIGIIRVKTVSVTYSLVSKNLLSRAADIASSAVTGKPASPNTLREISEGDVRSWRASRE